MRVFVTGASGWIGSAVTAELIAAGHQVVGLARSDASAEKVTAAGAEVQRGDITDLDSLRAGADGVDGVIHTAFIHDFTAMANSAAVDFAAVQLFGDLLEGSDRPLVIASGILGAVSVETDRPDPATSPSPRILTEQTLLGFADRGIRSSAVRLPPTVHGDGDHGFMAALIGDRPSEGELRLRRRRQQSVAGGPPPRCRAPLLPRAREGARRLSAARRRRRGRAPARHRRGHRATPRRAGGGCAGRIRPRNTSAGSARCLRSTAPPPARSRANCSAGSRRTRT